MKTNHLQSNPLSPETYAWYLDYLAAIDGKDVEKYGSYLADDCVMVQNNQEPIKGKTAVLVGLGHYWQSFHSLEHDLLNLYGTDSAFALEALNHYERIDGGKVTVRAVALTDRDGTGLVKYFRFYTDVTPVFAPAAGDKKERS